MSSHTKLGLLLLICVVAACGKKPEPPKGEPQGESLGRAETQNLRNVEALGYSGASVANKVDAALDANDQRKDNLDAAIDAQSSPR